MQVIIIGGFLGAGKTTALLQLARYLVGDDPRENKVVIIENEIGEVSIDDKTLSGSGYNVETMFAGCACCSISGQVEVEVRNIVRDFDPEYILFEASGVASPDEIRKNIVNTLGLDCRICVLVDAKRWLVLAKGVRLLLENQLKGANVVLLNKIDQVEPETVQEVRESVRDIYEIDDIVELSALEKIDENIWARVVGGK